jgi:hypothetical protein
MYNVLWNFCDIERRNLDEKSIFCHIDKTRKNKLSHLTVVNI